MSQTISGSTLEQVASYPLLKALLERRSRRFGRGFKLNGGPLAYESVHSPRPLSEEEEATLVFAACGITGPNLADLPYQTGKLPEASSGNVMTHFIGRTFASGDGIHSITLFVMNDEGTWMIKRPQDYPREEIAELAEAARRNELVELYRKSRIKISDKRLDIPREVPFTAPFNKWSANLPGTTYFLPVAELTTLYINIMLSAFDDEFAYYVLDDRNRYQPAGLTKFARSKGGHLNDDPASGRVGTVTIADSWLLDFAALEQGMMLQNLALMTEALGLGGFPHFATYNYIWPQTLGFRMEEPPLSRTMGAGPVMTALLKALKKDLPVPTAVGLEHNAQVLLKPYCPPYYGNMEEAVTAYVDYKYAQGKGTLRDGGAYTAWQDGKQVQTAIPRYSDKAIAATIAYCDYLYKRYGRFPINNGPFRTTLAHQAHHLDLDFYDKFYKPGAYTPAHLSNFRIFNQDFSDKGE